ncbi:MAG: hypothetical protein AB1401_06230 [Thermodesulfobacteriota bacterium]
MKPASDPFSSTLKCAVKKDGIALPACGGLVMTGIGVFSNERSDVV